MPVNHKQKTSLDGLREQIDAIDREIATLLLKRSEYVAQVGKLKTGQQVSGSYIRPHREATMLRALLSRFEGTVFPPAAVASIWRTIIGASTAMESPLNLAVLCRGEDKTTFFLSHEYFGDFIPSRITPQITEILEQIATHPHTIGVVPYEAGAEAHSWWEALAEAQNQAPATAPVVFATLPFVRNRRSTVPLPTALAFGRVELQPTGEDETLFAFRTEQGVRSSDWAEWYGKALAALALPQAGLKTCASGTSALFCVHGFYYEDAAMLEKLRTELDTVSGGKIIAGRAIGAYASAVKYN